MGKIKLTRSERVVVIVGLPSTGKTTLSKELANDYRGWYDHYHTDDYIKYGFEESLYVLRRELKENPKPVLIEGVQGYRLLRKGVELGDFFPDVVIVCAASFEVRSSRYRRRSVVPGAKINRGFDSLLEKFWNDYVTAINNHPRKPRFVIYNSEGGNNLHVNS